MSDRLFDAVLILKDGTRAAAGRTRPPFKEQVKATFHGIQFTARLLWFSPVLLVIYYEEIARELAVVSEKP